MDETQDETSARVVAVMVYAREVLCILNVYHEVTFWMVSSASAGGATRANERVDAVMCDGVGSKSNDDMQVLVTSRGTGGGVG